MMMKHIPHINLEKIRKAFVVFIAMWIIMASCSIQASIVRLANHQEQTTEQSSKLNKQKNINPVTVTSKTCDKNLSLDDNTYVVQKAGFDLSNPYVAILLTAILIVYFGYVALRNSNTHPKYENTKDLQGSTPLFIQYQNFRI